MHGRADPGSGRGLPMPDGERRRASGGGTGRPPSPVISLSGVSVVRDRRRILADLDWEVGARDRWVLLGPNGSGKTTLLQVAGARLLPSCGAVTVLGERFGRSDLRDVRARVALVSGATLRALRPHLSVREVVVTGRDAALLAVRGRYTQEDWVAADDVLRRVMGPEGPPSSRVSFGALSEGERQQVLIARALMCRAELLLFDEPAAGLDLGARERLVTRLAALAADPDVPAIVLVTHHLEEVPPGFTHGALVTGGRLLAAGPLEDVLTGPRVSACFGVAVDVERRHDRWRALAVA
jgi:iron complex transport system ATP-binding protein